MKHIGETGEIMKRREQNRGRVHRLVKFKSFNITELKPILSLWELGSWRCFLGFWVYFGFFKSSLYYLSVIGLELRQLSVSPCSVLSVSTVGKPIEKDVQISDVGKEIVPRMLSTILSSLFI